MATDVQRRRVWADDEALRSALMLAQRLPATGRKPAEYLLASAVLELNERVKELVAVVEAQAEEA